MMDQQWFDMQDVMKRSLATAVWLPVRAAHRISKQGRYGYPGFSEEFFGVGSVLALNSARSKVETLGWGDIGISHDHSPYIKKGRYQASDLFKDDDGKSIGAYLVLKQRSGAGEKGEWHLHQDFVLAYRLKREGDKWICPDENYADVARLTRDEEGSPSLFEVKAEFLKDYLCARKMGLYVTSYRQRVEVVEDRSHIAWVHSPERIKKAGIRWEGRVLEIHEGGHPFGSEMAVFQVSRTDVDTSVDIPVFGLAETEQNTKSKSWRTRREGKKLYRIEGELWRNEWVPGATKSPRFREDKMPPTVFFITDESGKRESRETLVDGDSRWLWFRPEVVISLSNRRGGSLSWYTRDTGDVRCSPDYRMHFGMNKLGLINVYAPDIGRLPDWQQVIWGGYNVAPEGGVSEELLASQMRAEPAKTQAPEEFLGRGIELLSEMTHRRFGFALFREHDEHERLLRAAHRFRATDRVGLFSLAKDLARLTADSINATAIQKVISLPQGQKLRSLKSLETLVAMHIDADRARSFLTPLFGIYELCHADAHLPSGDVEDALKMARVNTTLPFVLQGYAILHSCVSALYAISAALDDKRGESQTNTTA
jgi:hypothetical protein